MKHKIENLSELTIHDKVEVHYTEIVTGFVSEVNYGSVCVQGSEKKYYFGKDSDIYIVTVDEPTSFGSKVKAWVDNYGKQINLVRAYEGYTEVQCWIGTNQNWYFWSDLSDPEVIYD